MNLIDKFVSFIQLWLTTWNHIFETQKQKLLQVKEQTVMWHESRLTHPENSPVGSKHVFGLTEIDNVFHKKTSGNSLLWFLRLANHIKVQSCAKNNEYL